MYHQVALHCQNSPGFEQSIFGFESVNIFELLMLGFKFSLISIDFVMMYYFSTIFRM